MGMIKKEQVNKLPPIPEIPELKESVAASFGVVGPANGQLAGDDKMLKSGVISKQEWRDKDARISIDAIHKSTLESPTLGQLTVGHSEKEVHEITERYLRFNLELNRRIKAE